jgi:hypothetical protein
METRATEEVGVEQIYRLATFMDIKSLEQYMPGLGEGNNHA